MCKSATLLLGVALAAVSGGCASYYQVTDLSNNKEYYTTEVRQKDGATMLKDGKTGSQITIQNSAVKPITKEEYESGKAQ